MIKHRQDKLHIAIFSRFLPPYSYYLLFALGMFFYGCREKTTPLGAILYKASQNPVYKKLEPDSLRDYFKEYLAQHRGKLKNPNYLQAFYEQVGYEPILLNKFYGDSSLYLLLDYAGRIEEHGLSVKKFPVSSLKTSLYGLRDPKKINTVQEAYDGIVRAELGAAELLVQYCFSLEYGALNPMKRLPRYYIPVDRPDSLVFNKVLYTQDLGAYLDSIQPRHPAYVRIQEMLKKKTYRSDFQKVSLISTLERLRWRIPLDSMNSVYVNIPAYELTVWQEGEKVEQMKVVVGKADGHETPQLLSQIHSVQVNPIWNIPSSIARKEILAQAKADKFYLSNLGIDVYLHGKKIENPDSIQWAQYSEERLPYSFKQQPGTTNSLGLIKFLFKNGSSVYLHDTPAKGVFGRKMRAASHGCVRVEKPLALAYALFGEGEKYELIKAAMESPHPEAKTISLKPQRQVMLDYETCVLDSLGQLRFYPDVYKLDSVLYRALK